jgi:polysaccharide export outer membrane protein
MDAGPPPITWFASSRTTIVGLIALTLVGVGGCARNKIYSSADLPKDLQAPPVANVQTIDLSHLAGPPVRTDVIERGDVVEVSIAAGLNSEEVVKIPVRIGEDGMALLPEIGPIQLAGLSLTDAEQAISTTCVQRQFYRLAQVTITMKEQRENRITVVGAVEKPGVHALPRASSYLLAGIMQAGGLAKDAGPTVQIRFPRGDTAFAGGSQPGADKVRLASHEAAENVTYVCLNLADSVRQGEGSRYLPDGTVITVEKRQPTPIQVIGLVQKPGQYEFPVNHDLHVLDAIALAGGTRISMADKIYVIRMRPDGTEGVVQVSLGKAKHQRQENLRLEPGDVVSVEHTAPTAVLEFFKSLPMQFGASVPVL